jgi:SagB-type dehydrogenase family enzyme
MQKVWSAWLPYGAFHFGTKDVPFAPEEQVSRLLRRALAKSKPPAFFKRYAGVQRLRLPPRLAPNGEFPRVLMARRTHRKFSRADVPLASVSSLLSYTWGVTGCLPAPPLGLLPRKTSPSGGARHPGEVYLLALRVGGLAPGLYHYDARRHRLERLRKGEMQSKAFQYCAGQSHARNAAALFIMTAVLPRVMWKYPFARAYRVVLLDAGHLCQTFCLTATWLGLAPFCTAALKDSLIEQDLGIDGVSEVALYVAGVGMPLEPLPR